MYDGLYTLPGMQENRVQALKKEVDYSIRMAELIEYNLEDVDATILAVRAALASGMDWNDLTRMVKEEKKAGNPVAGLIHSLQLEKNCITLLLTNNLDDMDEDEKTKPADKTNVILCLHLLPRKLILYFMLIICESLITQHIWPSIIKSPEAYRVGMLI
eukprot:Gb_15415 [translate_table: standard]